MVRSNQTVTKSVRGAGGEGEIVWGEEIDSEKARPLVGQTRARGQGRMLRPSQDSQFISISALSKSPG